MGYQVKPRHDPREVILKAHGFSNRICDDSHTSGSERERERERERSWEMVPLTPHRITYPFWLPQSCGCWMPEHSASLQSAAHVNPAMTSPSHPGAIVSEK
jgi:hypothetical protein